MLPFHAWTANPFHSPASSGLFALFRFLSKKRQNLYIVVICCDVLLRVVNPTISPHLDWMMRGMRRRTADRCLHPPRRAAGPHRPALLSIKHWNVLFVPAEIPGLAETIT